MTVEAQRPNQEVKLINLANVLESVPLAEWREESEYFDSTFESTPYKVEGFQTTLYNDKGGEFTVRFEYLSRLNQSIPYRIKVSRYPSEDAISVNFHVRVGVPEKSRFEDLYGWLDKNIREPQEERARKARTMIREDFLNLLSSQEES